MVIKPGFKYARGFSEGLAAVSIIKGALPRWAAYGIVIGSGVLLFVVYRRLAKVGGRTYKVGHGRRY
jgi:hypothetical protein